MNRLAITRIEHNGKLHAASITLDEKREFIDFQLSEPEGTSLLNRICIGRVEEVASGIHAAFVRISDSRKCFLSLEDAKHPFFTKKNAKKSGICAGDEILVQVVRDAVKTKDPVVSCALTLQGACSILTTQNTSYSVSKKLSSEQRAEYRQRLSEWLSDAGETEIPFGIVVRTAAREYTIDQVKEDILNLVGKFQNILKTAKHLEAYQVLYENPPDYIQRLKSADLRHLEQIVTDQKDIYEQIQKDFPAANPLLSFYEDPAVSLSALYHIQGNIEKLTASRVWLKSGANIIIEQLETLTFIDVNSAKKQSKKPETLLEVNLEAAKEIARQIRLRSLSGMILIDFINLKSEEEEEKLIACLKEEIKKDPLPCDFIDITGLGIVELTRKRVNRSLREILMA